MISLGRLPRRRSFSIVCVCFLFLAPCSGQAQQSKLDRQVSNLISKMVQAKTEERAFADLEQMGCPAVPAIIRRMDDRRKLPISHIALKNKSSDAFESVRQYGPEQVVDALAAILNQITGRSFGFISNGASDSDRADEVREWQNLLQTEPSMKLCKAGTAK